MENSYINNIAHIYDEILRVHARFQAEVVKFRKNNVQHSELMGFYIPDVEIDNILSIRKLSENWAFRDNEDSEVYLTFQKMIKDLGTEISKKIKNTLAEGVTLNLIKLQQTYNLTAQEIEIIAICLAPQVETNYRKIFAYLQNDVMRKNPGVDLISRLIVNTMDETIQIRDLFMPQASLFRNRILEYIHDPNDPEKPLIAREVRLNNRIAGFLLEGSFIDEDLSPFAALREQSKTVEALLLPEDLEEQLQNFISYYTKKKKAQRENFIFSLHGPHGAEKVEMAGALCAAMEVPLLEVDIFSLFNSDSNLRKVFDLALRESKLTGAALCLKGCEVIFNNNETDAINEIHYILDQLNNHSWLTFIESNEPLSMAGFFDNQKLIEIELAIPDYQRRNQLWEHFLADHKIDKKIDTKEIAGKFNLTSGQIKQAVMTANTHALWRKPGKSKIAQDDLYEACHIHSNQRLKDLAQKINPTYMWEDIILIDESIELLKDMVHTVKNKHIVLDEWGFQSKLALGKGMSALFHGPPGTGKTMAADIMAHELKLDLYKIDISSVVSKYIGETEKNLNKIFTEAESSNAILFFDEADALFGKRTEVKDSHDRYANIEVSYLLQKIDEYPGVIILATNFSQNMDSAFVRRLHFSVNFPLPDKKSRLRIWKSIFPSQAPLSDDIDFNFLAKKFEISGGNIKNIALAAAFYAAEDGEKISMEQIIRACKREYRKINRLWFEKDFEIINNSVQGA